MAAREFTIHFVNDTDSRLKRQESPFYVQGEWSDGIVPPAWVMPRSTVHWKSESNGLWTGTEGEVAYRPLRDDPDGTYYPDIATVHWNNPYAGATDSAPNVELDRTPQPGGEAPRQTFALYGGGARDMGTFPGFGSSGWVDFIPGVVPGVAGLPVPNDPEQ